MANAQLPAYLASAKPNPPDARAPWFKNTAPAYFGIFMWIAFYDQLGGALTKGGLAGVLIGLVVAALLSHYLFHYVFGLLGMKTGYPLYVVGSSTFGTKGGFVFPGVFMGLLQIGWYSVGTYYATALVLRTFSIEPLSVLGPAESNGFSMLFIVVAIAWGYIFATLGAFGLKYVAMVSSYLPWIALLMLVIACVAAVPHVGSFESPSQSPSMLIAGMAVIQMVIGFFATAGAAGADFGTASRNADDVNKAGLFGVSLAAIVAGGLAVVAVAGAQGKYQASMASAEDAPAAAVAADQEGGQDAGDDAAKTATPPKFDIVSSFKELLPSFSRIVYLFLAIGSMAPACFCANIIGNSLSTMIPTIGRVPLTIGGATVGIVLAALGIAGNLVPFFGLIGASFGPICGAIVADYLLSGKKWAGPRDGVNIAGYGAWVVGFLVGISNNSLLFDPTELPGWYPDWMLWQPTPVYSFIVGFVVYAILAKAGMEPKTVEMPVPPSAPGVEPQKPVSPAPAPGEPLPKEKDVE
jgi:cytosine permease